eukprot:2748279-Rhodomonas_salina.1
MSASHLAHRLAQRLAGGGAERGDTSTLSWTAQESPFMPSGGEERASVAKNATSLTANTSAALGPQKVVRRPPAEKKRRVKPATSQTSRNLTQS